MCGVVRGEGREERTAGQASQSSQSARYRTGNYAVTLSSPHRLIRDITSLLLLLSPVHHPSSNGHTSGQLDVI